MKIFLDTASADEIMQGLETGLIDGVTTNPTLILKNGEDVETVYGNLISMGVEDLSMEIVTDDVGIFVSEGQRLKEKYGDATTIKVPCTPAGLKACKILTQSGIRVNVTLIFSAAQAILSAKAGASYISPFVGRVDDNSFDGIGLIKEISDIFTAQMVTGTEILAASIRDVHSVSEAFEVGADIVTLPPTVFKKMYNHILTEKGLALFEQDYRNTVGG
jgi:transaldolase|tara:strand:+ start:76 stop:729 length:654 start_codon:yes stop_codon:yes gene_type:complete